VKKKISKAKKLTTFNYNCKSSFHVYYEGFTRASLSMHHVMLSSQLVYSMQKIASLTKHALHQHAWLPS